MNENELMVWVKRFAYSALAVTSPYAALHFTSFFDASTQDFANFGTYISGVLTPIATFASVIFIGKQLVLSSKNNQTASENNKQVSDRNHVYRLQDEVRAYSELLTEILTNQKKLENHSEMMSKVIQRNTRGSRVDTRSMLDYYKDILANLDNASRKGMYISSFNFFHSRRELSDTFSVVSKTLYEIKAIDVSSYERSRAMTFSMVSNKKFAILEVLYFFYTHKDTWEAELESYDWIVKENLDELRNHLT